MKCICRNCFKIYDENVSRADWKGFCSQTCVHELAKKHGYSLSKEKRYGRKYSEYNILKVRGLIGSQYK